MQERMTARDFSLRACLLLNISSTYLIYLMQVLNCLLICNFIILALVMYPSLISSLFELYWQLNGWTSIPNRCHLSCEHRFKGGINKSAAPTALDVKTY